MKIDNKDTEPVTLGNILRNIDKRNTYEKKLLDMYFEILFSKSAPDEDLAREILRAFPSLLAVSYGKVVFTRDEFEGAV